MHHVEERSIFMLSNYNVLVTVITIKTCFMARMPYGPLGPIIGKIGSIIGVMGKSGPYVKAVQRKKKDKPGAAQQTQRERMAVVTRFLYSMRDLVTVTFYKNEDNRIPWNKAISCNMKNAVYTSGGRQLVKYSTAIVSQGDLPNAPLCPIVCNPDSRGMDCQPSSDN
jgi:hypothetical protein